MKQHHSLIALATSVLLAFSPAAMPQEAEDALRQAELKQAYQEAVAQAGAERAAAEAAVAEARERLAKAAEAEADSVEIRERALTAREAEMREMHAELARARERLNETSREIARIDREIARERARASGGSRWVVQTTQKPVIGVILGKVSDTGIEIIGVSPDGPAERAGIEKGDVLVRMAGQDLATGDEDLSEDNLQLAKNGLKEGESIVVTYRRNDRLVDVEVMPEVREPLAWHTVTRFPSITASPEGVVEIERIVVPEIDTAELAERIERIKVEVAERARRAVPEAPEAYEFEFHELSELGDTALYQANVWFGLPMAKGLKLAEVNPELGQYFKTDRGVLVLKARDGNELQLLSGDVVLKVGDDEVNSPAEFMRALREAEPGEELAIDIKRERRNKTLKTTMPERKSLGHLLHGGDIEHALRFNYTTD